MIWVLLQSESPWQHNDAITFFIYLPQLCQSLNKVYDSVFWVNTNNYHQLPTTTISYQ